MSAIPLIVDPTLQALVAALLTSTRHENTGVLFEDVPATFSGMTGVPYATVGPETRIVIHCGPSGYDATVMVEPLEGGAPMVFGELDLQVLRTKLGL